jgi:hypothetical protein
MTGSLPLFFAIGAGAMIAYGAINLWSLASGRWFFTKPSSDPSERPLPRPKVTDRYPRDAVGE